MTWCAICGIDVCGTGVDLCGPCGVALAQWEQALIDETRGPMEKKPNWFQRLKAWWDRPFERIETELPGEPAEINMSMIGTDTVQAHMNLLREVPTENVEEWLERVASTDDYVKLETEYQLAQRTLESMDPDDPRWPKAVQHSHEVEARFSKARAAKKIERTWGPLPITPPDPGIPENKTKP